MLGFIFGTICLFALIKVAKHSWGPSWGLGCGHHRHHRDHGPDWDSEGGSRFGSRFWLRGLYSRLETTPGQERVIERAVEDVMRATRTMRDELAHSRREIASAFRSESIDATQMGELFARHDEKLSEIRKVFVGALANVHDALDESQRRDLADFLERGLGGRFEGFGGPYRGRGWA